MIAHRGDAGDARRLDPVVGERDRRGAHEVEPPPGAYGLQLHQHRPRSAVQRQRPARREPRRDRDRRAEHEAGPRVAVSFQPAEAHGVVAARLVRADRAGSGLEPRGQDPPALDPRAPLHVPGPPDRGVEPDPDQRLVHAVADERAGRGLERSPQLAGGGDALLRQRGSGRRVPAPPPGHAENGGNEESDPRHGPEEPAPHPLPGRGSPVMRAAPRRQRAPRRPTPSTPKDPPEAPRSGSTTSPPPRARPPPRPPAPRPAATRRPRRRGRARACRRASRTASAAAPRGAPPRARPWPSRAATRRWSRHRSRPSASPRGRDPRRTAPPPQPRSRSRAPASGSSHAPRGPHPRASAPAPGRVLRSR